MFKKKKKGYLIFSDTPIRTKFLLIDGLYLLSLILAVLITLKTITATSTEKYRNSEKAIIAASEQIMEMGVESAVSVAKSIYSNDSIYEFLDCEYKTEAEYYNAFYPLKQGTALGNADVNIIKNCTIYTENPTVLNGATIQSLRDAYNSSWYKNYTKRKKSIILDINPETGVFTLVRKLDYAKLSTGDSFICLEINMKMLRTYFDNLGFDGELFIVSGSNLVYSNDPKVTSPENMPINNAFNCTTRNYHTVDIEYYSCESKTSFLNHLLSNKLLLIFTIINIVLIFVTSLFLAHGMRTRANEAIKEYNDTGSAINMRDKVNGNDEIGKLLNICAAMSERLNAKGNEYKMSSDSLNAISSDYQKLFTTALKLDAELSLRDKYPDVFRKISDEEIPLNREFGFIRKIAKIHSATVDINVADSEKYYIPACGLALIADDVFSNYSICTLRVTAVGGVVTAVFESPDSPEHASILKLRAIFEENTVADEYAFETDYRFNPYIRLKHCMGGNAELSFLDNSRIHYTLTLRLSTERRTSYEN